MTGARVTRPASDTAHSLAITPHTHSGEKKKQVHTETAPRPEKLYSRLSKTRSRLQVLQAADRHTGSVHRTDHLAAMERHHLQRHPPWPGSKPASTRRRRSREGMTWMIPLVRFVNRQNYPLEPAGAWATDQEGTACRGAEGLSKLREPSVLSGAGSTGAHTC